METQDSLDAAPRTLRSDRGGWTWPELFGQALLSTAVGRDFGGTMLSPARRYVRLGSDKRETNERLHAVPVAEADGELLRERLAEAGLAGARGPMQQDHPGEGGHHTISVLSIMRDL